jgi:dihydroflavonol-4-reductase
MILVTGGTGLLGSHLLLKLCLEGAEPRALFRKKERLERVKAVFQHYEPKQYVALFSKISWVEGDILDLPSIETAIKGCEEVYHCAGLVSFASRDFKNLMKVNAEGTSNIVNCCLTFHVRKLCYVSSTAAIGYNEGGRTDETTTWKNSPEVSGYSVSKYTAEKEVWRGIEEGLNAVIVNPCVIFGAGSWEESSLSIFKTVNNGLPFITPGSNSFVDARDVVEIMFKLMEGTLHSERFLCTGDNLSFKELTTKIALRLNKRHPLFSTPRFLAELGWRLVALMAFVRRKNPVITKDTVSSAYKQIAYDSTKVTSTLSFSFRGIDDTISNTISGRIH